MAPTLGPLRRNPVMRVEGATGFRSPTVSGGTCATCIKGLSLRTVTGSAESKMQNQHGRGTGHPSHERSGLKRQGSMQVTDPVVEEPVYEA